MTQTDNLTGQTNSLTISPTIKLASQTVKSIINPIGNFKINPRINRTDSIKQRQIKDSLIVSQIKDSLIVSQIRDKQMDNVSQTLITIIGNSLTTFYVQDVEDRITSVKIVEHISM